MADKMAKQRPGTLQTPSPRSSLQQGGDEDGSGGSSRRGAARSSGKKSAEDCKESGISGSRGGGAGVAQPLFDAGAAAATTSTAATPATKAGQVANPQGRGKNAAQGGAAVLLVNGLHCQQQQPNQHSCGPLAQRSFPAGLVAALPPKPLPSAATTATAATPPTGHSGGGRRGSIHGGATALKQHHKVQQQLRQRRRLPLAYVTAATGALLTTGVLGPSPCTVPTDHPWAIIQTHLGATRKRSASRRQRTPLEVHGGVRYVSAHLSPSAVPLPPVAAACHGAGVGSAAVVAGTVGPSSGGAVSWMIPGGGSPLAFKQVAALRPLTPLPHPANGGGGGPWTTALPAVPVSACSGQVGGTGQGGSSSRGKGDNAPTHKQQAGGRVPAAGNSPRAQPSSSAAAAGAMSNHQHHCRPRPPASGRSSSLSTAGGGGGSSGAAAGRLMQRSGLAVRTGPEDGGAHRAEEDPRDSPFATLAAASTADADAANAQLRLMLRWVRELGARGCATAALPPKQQQHVRRSSSRTSLSSAGLADFKPAASIALGMPPEVSQAHANELRYGGMLSRLLTVRQRRGPTDSRPSLGGGGRSSARRSERTRSQPVFLAQEHAPHVLSRSRQERLEQRLESSAMREGPEYQCSLPDPEPRPAAPTRAEALYLSERLELPLAAQGSTEARQYQAAEGEGRSDASSTCLGGGAKGGAHVPLPEPTVRAPRPVGKMTVQDRHKLAEVAHDALRRQLGPQASAALGVPCMGISTLSARCWSQPEVAAFAVALDQVDRDFHQIRARWLPGRPMAHLVELYFNVWKLRILPESAAWAERRRKLREEEETEPSADTPLCSDGTGTPTTACGGGATSGGGPADGARNSSRRRRNRSAGGAGGSRSRKRARPGPADVSIDASQGGLSEATAPSVGHDPDYVAAGNSGARRAAKETQGAVAVEDDRQEHTSPQARPNMAPSAARPVPPLRGRPPPGGSPPTEYEEDEGTEHSSLPAAVHRDAAVMPPLYGAAVQPPAGLPAAVWSNMLLSSARIGALQPDAAAMAASVPLLGVPQVGPQGATGIAAATASSGAGTAGGDELQAALSRYMQEFMQEQRQRLWRLLQQPNLMNELQPPEPPPPQQQQQAPAPEGEQPPPPPQGGPPAPHL